MMNFYEGGDDSVLPEEFEAAVVRHYDTLLRLAVQRAGSRTEAEDIVQDTFLQLLRSGRTFDDEEHLKAFLIRAVINHCKTYPQCGALRSSREHAPRRAPAGFRRKRGARSRAAAASGIPRCHLPVLLRGVFDTRDRADARQT